MAAALRAMSSMNGSTSAYGMAALDSVNGSLLPWAASAGAQLDRQLGAYLSERLVVRAAGQPCAVSAAGFR